jgi:hypothetical protein
MKQKTVFFMFIAFCCLSPTCEGFQKREIGKALLHPNGLLQRSSLQYLTAVLQRLTKTISGAASASAAHQAAKIEASVANAMHQHLPDFHLLLNLRSR